MTENRFENNDNLYILLDGFYAFANISSNNFTDNFSFEGLMELRGVEKKLVLERNRFITNKVSSAVFLSFFWVFFLGWFPKTVPCEGNDSDSTF